MYQTGLQEQLQNKKRKFFKFILYPAVFILFPILAGSFPIRVMAGSSFTHTHTPECEKTVSVPCDGEYETYTSQGLTTRHCVHCMAQTTHSQFLTHRRCKLTGYSVVVSGATTCQTCNQPGYGWTASFEHNREKVIYTCGAGQSEVTANVTLHSGNTALTNQDVTLNAGVDIVNAKLAGSNFLYSWDGSTWSTDSGRNVSENGTYTVRVKNAAGEIAEASLTVSNIDKIAPVINSISHDENGMTKEKVQITISASDENGIAGYSFDGGATWQAENGCFIRAGQTYPVAVKDNAGNVTLRTVRREDFPYPYEPPAPSVRPEEKDTSETHATDKTAEKTADSSEKTSAVSEKKDSSANGQNTGRDVKRDKAEKEKEKGKEAGDTKEAYGGLVPKIMVSSNCLFRNGVSENSVSASDVKIQVSGNAPSQSAGEALSEYSGENSMGANLAESAQTTRKGNISVSAVLAAGLLAMFVLLGYGIYCFLETGVLYTMDDTESTPFFRRLQRVRIQKTERGYKLILPAYISQSENSGHFRLLLSKYRVKEGKNKQIYIYTGQRKLVADMEECIDFVL